MTDEPFDPEAELAAIHARMRQPLSREQQIATELQLYLDLAAPKPLAQWTDEDWLVMARYIIRVVEHSHDISAEDAAKAMDAPPRHPLPTFDELDAP
jgi:hypothetical protein